MLTAYSMVATDLSRSSIPKPDSGQTDSERHYSERVPPSTHNPQELVTSVPVREPFNASILFSFLEGRVVLASRP